MAVVLIKTGNKDEFRVRSRGIRTRTARTRGVDHGLVRIVKRDSEYFVTAKWKFRGQFFTPKWRDVGSFKTLVEAKRQAAGFFIIRA